jgi:hypothetical protein
VDRHREKKVTLTADILEMGLAEALEFAQKQRQRALRLVEDLGSRLREPVPDSPPEQGESAK